MPDASANNRQIGIWLILVCAAILIMLMIGGATRLTHSGLSMMTWDPLMGWIPPLNEQQWLDSFAHYKKIPEFYELNPDMDLAGYKRIFILEYVHRVWGRLIGLFFLVPFLYFLLKGKIASSLRPKLAMMFLLGGLQGLLGWYMVSSGFTSPHVSQYRLTAHLTTAFIIYGYILWVALGLLFPREDGALYGAATLKRLSIGMTGLILLTVMAGGMVAGLRAGFAYNTFPLMDGHFVPDGYAMLKPFYKNLFENIAAVQFDHRVLAETTVLCAWGLWWYGRRLELSDRARLALNLLAGMALIQFALGVSTLLLVVPTWLAVIHQGGAMLLFSFALFLNHTLQKTA